MYINRTIGLYRTISLYPFFMLIIALLLWFIFFSKVEHSHDLLPKEKTPEIFSYTFQDNLENKYRVDHYDFNSFAGKQQKLCDAFAENGQVLSFFDNGFYFFNGSSAVEAIPVIPPNLCDEILEGPEKWSSISQRFPSELDPHVSDSYHTSSKIFHYCTKALRRNLGRNLASLSALPSGATLLETTNKGLYTYKEGTFNTISSSSDYSHPLVTDSMIAVLQFSDNGSVSLKVINEKGHLICETSPIAGHKLSDELKILPIGHSFAIYDPYYSQIYTIASCDLENQDSVKWKRTTLDPEDWTYLFASKRGIVLKSNKDARFYCLTLEGIKFSSYFTNLSNHASLENIIESLEITNPRLKGWYATRKGFLKISSSLSSQPDNILPYSFEGFSARGLDFNGDSTLWVSSYSGTFQLSFKKKNDSLPPAPEWLSPFSKEISYFVLNSESSHISATSPAFYYYDKISDSLKKFTSPVIKPWHPSSFVYTAQKELFVGTSSGLFRGDPKKTQSGFHPVIFSSPEQTLSNVFVNRIKSHNGTDTLLICGKKGLHIGSINNKARHEIEWIQSCLGYNVHDAVLMKDQTLLLATEHSGLLWLDSTEERKLIYAFDKENHLISNYTHNIQLDSLQRIWLGTNHGLYSIDLNKGLVRMFGKEDGFPDNEFNRLSSAQSPKGLLAFGGIKGVTVFNPYDIGGSDSIVPVTIAALLVESEHKHREVLPTAGKSYTFSYEAILGPSTLYPIPDQLGLHATLPLYYRTDSTSFWKKAINNKISTSNFGKSTQLQLKWVENNQILYSSTILIKRSRGFTFVSRSILAFLSFLLLTTLIFRKRIQGVFSRVRAELNDEVEKLTKHSKEDEGETETATEGTVENPLEVYLNDLRKKEDEVFTFPKRISSQFLADLRDILESEIENPGFSVDFVAKHLHLSPRHFHRKLLNQTGITPNKLFAHYKTKRAKELIIQDLDIRTKDLSNKLGYSNTSYFSRLFKDLYGITPTQLSIKIKKLANLKLPEGVNKS